MNINGVKQKYQYIHFVIIANKPRTQVYSCRNNRSMDELGQIKWYGPWRQYCYFPTVQAVYSAGCLKDIQDFMEELKNQ
jgi:hypothetical protein